jgi:S-disulfanyl-L-cysteine oxidoreductase SoxD
MPGLKWIIPLALSFGGTGASAADLQPQVNFGTPVTEEELARYLAIPPSGTGLPPGRGDVARGKEVYAAKCAACHGEHLEGVKEAGGAAFLGGRGSLASAKPMKTVESYWPYSTTIFDYVKRAMPFNAPGSLTNEEVYAVTAYILANARVVPEDAILDAGSLPKVEMPNRRGFYPDPRSK